MLRCGRVESQFNAFLAELGSLGSALAKDASEARAVPDRVFEFSVFQSEMSNFLILIDYLYKFGLTIPKLGAEELVPKENLNWKEDVLRKLALKSNSRKT